MASSHQRPGVGPGERVLDGAAIVVHAGAEREQARYRCAPDAGNAGGIGTGGADVGEVDNVGRSELRVEAAIAKAELVQLAVRDLQRMAEGVEAIALLANKGLGERTAGAVRLIAFAVVIEAAEGKAVFAAAQRTIPGQGVLHVGPGDHAREIALEDGRDAASNRRR